MHRYHRFSVILEKLLRGVFLISQCIFTTILTFCAACLTIGGLEERGMGSYSASQSLIPPPQKIKGIRHIYKVALDHGGCI